MNGVRSPRAGTLVSAITGVFGLGVGVAVGLGVGVGVDVGVGVGVGVGVAVGIGVIFLNGVVDVPAYPSFRTSSVVRNPQ